MTKVMDRDLIMMVKPNLQTQRIRIHIHQSEWSVQIQRMNMHIM